MTFGFGGCTEDPVAPRASSLTINPEPDSINAPWLLSGPEGFSQEGVGDTTFTTRVLGEYTLTWGAVSGYLTPAAQMRTLIANASLTFSGTYVQPRLPFPDSPDQLMLNFKTICEDMDFAEYASLLHPDYFMILQQSTQDMYPSVGSTLDVVEERRIHERMFSKQDVTDPDGALVPGLRTIEFRTFVRSAWSLSPPTDVIPNADCAVYQVSFQFDRGAAQRILKVEGEIKFYVTHRDSVINSVTRPYYQMYGQIDLTLSSALGSKASALDSWGSVKCLFR
jgi:hypothetical protein